MLEAIRRSEMKIMSGSWGLNSLIKRFKAILGFFAFGISFGRPGISVDLRKKPSPKFWRFPLYQVAIRRSLDKLGKSLRVRCACLGQQFSLHQGRRSFRRR